MNAELRERLLAVKESIASSRTALEETRLRCIDLQKDLNSSDVLYTLYQLDELKKELTEFRKDVETGHGAAGLSFIDLLVRWGASLMTAAGFDEASVDGVKFILDASVKPTLPSVKSEQHAEWMTWLKEMGYDEVIKQSVSWSAAASLLTDLSEQGRPIPEFIKWTTVPRIKIRRK